MSNSGKGGSRVSIPTDLYKTIQQIREIKGKQHFDEDILSVFKDCSNDPHETTHKLLYLDTFHEVKSKRERKKEIIVPDTQGRGRDGRRNFASNYTGHYANNGRSAAFKRKSGTSHVKAGPRTALPATNKAINDTIPRSIKSPNPRSCSNGVTNHKIQDGFIFPVNNGLIEEQPLSKSTSSSKASYVPVVVSASYYVDGTSKISQKAYTFTKQDSMLIATCNCSTQSDKVIRSEAAANKSKNQPLIEIDFGARPHVTFPAHLSKILEDVMTFASFDSNFVKEACDNSNVEFSHGKTVYEASTREDLSTLSLDKDFETSNSAFETEILSLQSDQRVHPTEGSKGDKPKEKLIPITDTHQGANSDTPPPTISYPDQCSIATSQQVMHLFRQQYPPNVYPYGPCFPPFYMPQLFIHPFLNPMGNQQPPGEDVPTPTPPESTLPLPQIRSGSNTRNSSPTAVPSPYYSINHFPSAATMVKSTQNEEKREDIYTNGPLSAWVVAQSLANLQFNQMYNLSLQGQPLPFPTAQPGFNGLYQQPHLILAAPTMNQTLPTPPAISSMTEPMGVPHITNQQPQAALTKLGDN